MKAPRSVLPKALRRDGKRPLQPEAGRRELELLERRGRQRSRPTHSKRRWAFLQRTVYAQWQRLGRQAKRAAKA